jgi:hypothetical protein
MVLIKLFGLVLRLYSFLFHTILCLFLVGVVLVSRATHVVPKLGFLPFTDENMITGLTTLAAVGLVSVFLAVTDIFRYIFPVWTAIVLWLMVKGFILSPFTFPNAETFHGALWLTFGALGAFFGGLWVLRNRPLRI